jgi:endonuclease I
VAAGGSEPVNCRTARADPEIIRDMHLSAVAASPVSSTPIAPAAQATSHNAASTQWLAVTPAQDLDKYYAPAQGKEGADLLHSLHIIVRTGHVDRGYAQARDELFSEVGDVDGDNMIEDIFTGEARGPITDRKNAYDKGMNTEHTWAQSKGATGIAQSDLHHLQPADIRTNEKRGSFPYGEVIKTTWSTGSGVHQAKLGVDSLGATVFEPQDSVKGDIARGLLYFYTRYYESRPDRFQTDDFKHELPTLLKWNAQDPVDDRERKRNDAVQAVQGNRNPYIDHPEFVDEVAFGKLAIK